ncbi:MAG: hypothetical protein ACP5M4_15515 [Acidobacteriaceae bacterium]
MVTALAAKRWTSHLLMLGMFATCAGTPARAERTVFPPPPAKKDVTISNGGLSVTFNIAWGAVVVAVSNSRIAHGLNIVDTHDVGRELQVDQFLHLTMDGHQSLMINPTQAGALGRQRYYQHPHGVVIPEVGSKVVQWKAGRSHFHAVIDPLDYDTGNPTNWVYVEDVRIDKRGVAHFHFTFYNHEPKTYLMGSEVPTLYSDRTDAFEFPLISPYSAAGAAYRNKKDAEWPVKMVPSGDHWPSGHLKSEGWIANIDTRDNLGIFYTTPVGFPESYGAFQRAGVSDRYPLGKTNVVAGNLTSYPGEIYSIEYSVLVSTPTEGPALISKQPPAVLKIVRNDPPEQAK